MSLNKVLLIGDVGADPEIRYMENGMAFATFSLCTTDFYRDNQGVSHRSSEWHRILAWQALAQKVQQQVRKGDTLFIEGSLRTRTKELGNGIKQQQTEIVAQSLEILSKPLKSRDVNIVEQNPLQNIEPDEDNFPF